MKRTRETIQTTICTCEEDKKHCEAHGPKRPRLLYGERPNFSKKPFLSSSKVQSKSEPKREYFRVRKDKPSSISWLDWIRVESTLLHDHLLPEIEDIIRDYIDPELSGSQESGDDSEHLSNTQEDSEEQPLHQPDEYPDDLSPTIEDDQ